MKTNFSLKLKFFIICAFVLIFSKNTYGEDFAAVVDVNTFGFADGEFSMNNLKGLYSWTVPKKFLEGKYIIKSNNTFGIGGGKFLVDGIEVKNERGFTSKIPFDDSKNITGFSDLSGWLAYERNQKASLSSSEIFFPNPSYSIIPKDGKVFVEEFNTFLTCADGTEVEFFALWLNILPENITTRFIISEKYSGMRVPSPIYHSTSFSNNEKLRGIYKNGAIRFEPNQKVSIQSSKKIMLEDGTIILPNDNGLYNIIIKNGIPYFNGVKAFLREGNEDIF
jgi:hypothetical protein